MEKFNSLLSTGYLPTGIISLPFQGKEVAKGFTLVELIVVITILAILGTIAFISLQGYSKDARDSVRISDISKIKTSLELFQLDAGKYPETTDAFSVTYSGAVAWTQGIFGETTYSSVEKLDKIPTDPVTDRKYVYSVTNTKQEYQIAGVMEGDEVSYRPLPNHPLSGEGIAALVNQTNAAGKTAMLKISGNYNGKLLKVSTGGTDYVLAVPSLITSSGTTLEQIVAEKLLAYNGYKNLPSLYAGSSYEVLGDDEINLINSDDLVVYSGSLSLLSDTTSTGVSARKILIENLQSAYAGTDITSVGEIAQIIDTNKNDSNAVEVLSSTIVNNDLGGNLVVTNSAPLIDKTTCESASWIRVEPENDVYIGSTKGNGFCISPRFGDWQTNGTDLDDGAGGISWNGWGNYSLDSYNGWDASNTSIRDTGNFTSQYGQTRTLDSEVSYNCKPLGTSGSDYETTDTIAGRMKWLATTGNTYYQARSIDWITGY